MESRLTVRGRQVDHCTVTQQTERCWGMPVTAGGKERRISFWTHPVHICEYFITSVGTKSQNWHQLAMRRIANSTEVSSFLYGYGVACTIPNNSCYTVSQSDCTLHHDTDNIVDMDTTHCIRLPVPICTSDSHSSTRPPFAAAHRKLSLKLHDTRRE